MDTSKLHFLKFALIALVSSAVAQAEESKNVTETKLFLNELSQQLDDVGVHRVPLAKWYAEQNEVKALSKAESERLNEYLLTGILPRIEVIDENTYKFIREADTAILDLSKLDSGQIVFDSLTINVSDLKDINTLTCALSNCSKQPNFDFIAKRILPHAEASPVTSFHRGVARIIMAPLRASVAER